MNASFQQKTDIRCLALAAAQNLSGSWLFNVFQKTRQLLLTNLGSKFIETERKCVVVSLSNDFYLIAVEEETLGKIYLATVFYVVDD